MRLWLLLWLLLAAPAQGSNAAPICDADAATLSALDPAQRDAALPELLRCPIAASDAGAIDRVRALLDAGADPQYADATGRTALHAALESIHLPGDGPVHFYRDAARLLLARGADPLASDAAAIQPLHLAAREHDGQVTQLLLDLQADPLAPDARARTPLQYAASGTDNLDTFALLLRAAGDTALPTDTLQALALLAAARHDHGKLNLLLQLSPEITLDGLDASAALARALWQGAPMAVAQRLVDAGADPGLLPDTGGGDLAWRLATLGREAELDWLLASGFPLNALPASGIPPLFYADLPATRLLLDRGADPALSSATLGPTAAALTPPDPPFEEGGRILSPDKLSLLLAAGYPVDLRDPQGRTALEHAVRNDTHWLTRALLEAGASALASSDGAASLLPLAVSHARTTTIQLLLRAVDDAQQRHPELLLHAVSVDQPKALPLEALLVAGFDTEARNPRGETPLLVAARRQLWPLVSLLLRYGADAQALNHAGCGLQCYAWAMPEPVYTELAPHLRAQSTGWVAPQLDQRPASFFALALTPVLACWLLLCGWLLLRRRPLLPATGWLLLSALSAVLAGGALFYRCQPCLVSDPRPQMGITASLALALFALLAWHYGTRRSAQASTDMASPDLPAAAPRASEELELERQPETQPQVEPEPEPTDDAVQPASDEDWHADDWPASEDEGDRRLRNPDGTPRGFW